MESEEEDIDTIQKRNTIHKLEINKIINLKIFLKIYF
jgi:hypothetical protein